MKYLYSLILVLILNSIVTGSTCFYKETLTIGTSTAVGISSSAKEPDLMGALLSVEGANLRFWYDGSIPSTSTGHLLLENDFIYIEGQNNLRNLQMISAGTSNVNVRLSYEH